jgi:hypothetical protein
MGLVYFFESAAIILQYNFNFSGNCNYVVGTVNRLRIGRWGNYGSILSTETGPSLVKNVKTGTGATQPFIYWVLGVLDLRINLQGNELGHSPIPSVKVNHARYPDFNQ